MAPVFIPIAVIFGHIFRLYEDQNLSRKEGRGRRLLYDLPIILQSLMAISFLTLPFFIKDMKLNKYLEISHVEKWWWLVILPILAQVMIIFLPAQAKRRWRNGWFVTVTLLSTLFLISVHFIVAQLLTPSRSAYPVSKAVQALLPPNQELYQFRMSLYGIDFYNKMRTPLVEACGELEFGFTHLPPAEFSHYYLISEELFKRCKEKGVLYCVTRDKKNVEALKRGVSVLEILWENGEFYLLRLRG